MKENNEVSLVLEEDDPELILEQKRQDRYTAIRGVLIGLLSVVLVGGVMVLCRVSI